MKCSSRCGLRRGRANIAPYGKGQSDQLGRSNAGANGGSAKVKAALIQAPDVKGGDVNVQTQKGVVQLSGFVSTQTEIERAMEVARAVKGVTEVHNKMSLKSGK